MSVSLAGICARTPMAMKCQAGNAMNVYVALVNHLYGVLSARTNYSPYLQTVDSYTRHVRDIQNGSNLNNREPES